MIEYKLLTRLFKGQAIKITMELSKQFKMATYTYNFEFWTESKAIDIALLTYYHCLFKK